MGETIGGLIYEQDVRIPITDGVVLRANVYRPAATDRYPVLMAQGVYGKDVHFSMGFPAQ